jgi:hypothetical protein
MAIGYVFWLVIGLGIVIPTTAILILNLLLKAKNGDNYNLSGLKVAVLYAISIVGWAIIAQVIAEVLL